MFRKSTAYIPKASPLFVVCRATIETEDRALSPGEELLQAFFFCENASVFAVVSLSKQTLILEYPELMKLQHKIIDLC